MQPLSIPAWKWDDISMDFIVGLPPTPRKHDSIWVIVDRLTKTAHFIPVHTTYSAERYAEIYVDLIVRLHGVPKTILSDRGTQFVARFCAQVHESLGTKCWWKSGPKGGRRHNSPLNSLLAFALSCEVPTSTSTWARKGNAETYEDGTRKNTLQTEDRRTGKGLRCSLLITGCPFHYKGFTIYRRPLGIVICLNYNFSVPDSPL
jgi:hypothetical protein